MQAGLPIAFCCYVQSKLTINGFVQHSKGFCDDQQLLNRPICHASCTDTRFRALLFRSLRCLWARSGLLRCFRFENVTHCHEADHPGSVVLFVRSETPLLITAQWLRTVYSRRGMHANRSLSAQKLDRHSAYYTCLKVEAALQAFCVATSPASSGQPTLQEVCTVI